MPVKHLQKLVFIPTFANTDPPIVRLPMAKTCGTLFSFIVKTSCWSLAAFYCFAAKAQDNKSSFFSKASIGVQGHYGSFLTTRAKAEYIQDSYASFGEIFFQKQTDKNQRWQRSHKLPQWGLSLAYGNTGSRKYIGNLYSVSAYVTTPLITAKGYRAAFRLGAGPGWVDKPFDIHSNPKNTLIGTKLNAYILMMLQNEIQLTPRIFLNAGVSFIHVSNGGTSLPNLGLNTPAVSMGLRYALQDEYILPVKKTIDSFSRKIDYRIFASVGLKQAPWIGGRHYIINVVQAELGKRFAFNHVYGAGVVAFYNRSLEYDPLENPDMKKNKKRLQAGVYGFYEHFFGKLSIPLQVGAYVYNRDRFPFLFQQFGLRMQVSKHISSEVLLKIHSGQADFIHAGIGYTF
jgi:hypothetical protein